MQNNKKGKKMLAKIILKLKNITDKKVTTNMSSVFHGILMELLDEDFVMQLHNQQRHPYSQYIKCESDFIYWIISTVTKEAYEKIIMRLLDSKLVQIYSQYHDITFEIQNKKIEYTKEKDFLQEQYFKDFSRSFDITFLTPVSFKSGGQYMNYPTVRWIFQSLMNKHDSSEEVNRIFDADVLQLIEEQVSITQYKLRSTVFYLEGTKISSFIGSVKLYAKCSQSIVNLINYLLKYGEYSGVGIKSALGMGAILVESKERKIKQ